jgi:hypothetical protein
MVEGIVPVMELFVTTRNLKFVRVSHGVVLKPPVRVLFATSKNARSEGNLGSVPVRPKFFTSRIAREQTEEIAPQAK